MYSAPQAAIVRKSQTGSKIRTSATHGQIHGGRRMRVGMAAAAVVGTLLLLGRHGSACCARRSGSLRFGSLSGASNAGGGGRSP